MTISLDGAIQFLARKIGDIRWRNFDGESRYRWYYAEDEIYLVNDEQTKAFYLVRAKGPVKALERIKSKAEGD